MDFLQVLQVLVIQVLQMEHEIPRALGCSDEFCEFQLYGLRIAIRCAELQRPSEK